jgi:3-oxoacyl-[acyl-carrier protein] reductase
VRSKDSFRRVLEEAGEVDVMVNNAARTVSRPFWEIEQDEWDDVLAVNLRSVLFGCQLAGEQMRERGRGRIINLSSLAGQQGGAVAGAHYAASKAGIIVLTKIVAQELAPHGVTVNAIAPAAVRTPVMDGIPRDRLEALRSRIPVGRFGEAQEVGALAAFLASNEAGYITGATLDVNGGLLMR